MDDSICTSALRQSVGKRTENLLISARIALPSLFSSGILVRAHAQEKKRFTCKARRVGHPTMQSVPTVEVEGCQTYGSRRRVASGGDPCPRCPMNRRRR